MLSASESVSNGTEAAAWLDHISFCSGFCHWIEELSIDSLPADSQQPVESTRASAAEAEQPSAEKRPTGQRKETLSSHYKIRRILLSGNTFIIFFVTNIVVKNVHFSF